MRAAVMLALSLSACNQSGFSQGDDNICFEAPPISMTEPKDLTTQLEARDGCIHRWAYRLSGAPDSANTIVDAVLAGCHDTITGTAAYMVKEGTATTASLQEALDDARRQALFNVVQARAGKCRADVIK
jgi:hypothetical protein